MDVDGTKQYSLRWEKHAFNLAAEAGFFFEDESFLDCTLSAEGQSIQAHKIILSASSSYLSSLLKVTQDKHPILIFNDIKFEHLQALVRFIYNGSVSVSEDNIHGLIQAAQSLLIKGLSQGDSEDGGKCTAGRKVPDLTDMKPAARRPSGGGRGGGGGKRGGGVRQRAILPKGDPGPHPEGDEPLPRMDEVSVTRGALPQAVATWHSVLHEDRMKAPGDSAAAYVVKSWKHNSLDDINGKQKHSKQYTIGSALFKKFKLDRPQSEPLALHKEDPPPSQPGQGSDPAETAETRATSQPPAAEDVVKSEAPEEMMLVEPKQEVIEEEDEAAEDMEEDEEEEDTNSEHPRDRPGGALEPPGFGPRPDIDPGVPVPLLMCKTSLVEAECGEPPWMGGGLQGGVAAPPGSGPPGADGQDGQQDLPCPTCTKRYKSRYALNRHILYECGKARKSFACDECGKKVTRQDTLQKHKLIHLVQHLKDKEKEKDRVDPYTVKRPSKVYSNAAKLKP